MMRQHGKQWICPWPSESAPRVRSWSAGERGYAFLILMMMVTILLISLTTALPSIYQEGQREKEEEADLSRKRIRSRYPFFPQQIRPLPFKRQ